MVVEQACEEACEEAALREEACGEKDDEHRVAATSSATSAAFRRRTTSEYGTPRGREAAKGREAPRWAVPSSFNGSLSPEARGEEGRGV